MDQALKIPQKIQAKNELKKYKPLVISGCSGVGKGTLIKFLLSKYPQLFELSVSLTTRKPRAGQLNGREYFFMEKDQFQKQIDKNVFAEFCQVHGNYYGTHQEKLNQIINKGKICLLDIDLQGGQKIHKKLPDFHFLFIDPPNFQSLEQRLRNRGTETPESLQKRLKNAKGQLQVVKTLQYYNHLVNDDLIKAQKDILQYLNKNYGLNLSF